MVIASGKIRRFLFGISPDEATFARRGFHVGNEEARQHLELSAKNFIQGYHAALETPRVDELIPRLQNIPLEFQGFAYEGAAMGLAVLDYFLPSPHYFKDFSQGPGAHHIYMLNVGAGWTIARVPFQYQRLMKRLDPLLGWLAIDGYGFHQGFFSSKKYIDGRHQPTKLSPSAQKVFDQGLGRSLWFVKGADVSAIIDTLSTFPQTRTGDLWSGIGLACAYAGGVSQSDMQKLRDAAAHHWPQLAQGVAFAAKARLLAGNPTSHTEQACKIICNTTIEETAHCTDVCLEGLSHTSLQAYEQWRQRIQTQMSERSKINDVNQLTY